MKGKAGHAFVKTFETGAKEDLFLINPVNPVNPVCLFDLSE
jgi:hypothetical protein